jgi:hypothetical protein
LEETGEWRGGERMVEIKCQSMDTKQTGREETSINLGMDGMDPLTIGMEE